MNKFRWILYLNDTSLDSDVGTECHYGICERYQIENGYIQDGQGQDFSQLNVPLGDRGSIPTI